MQSIWGNYSRRRSPFKIHSKSSLLKRFVWSNYFEMLESLQCSSRGMSSSYAKSVTLRFNKSKEVILRCRNTCKAPIEAWYSHIRISSSFEMLTISRVLLWNLWYRGHSFSWKLSQRPNRPGCCTPNFTLIFYLFIIYFNLHFWSLRSHVFYPRQSIFWIWII